MSSPGERAFFGTDGIRGLAGQWPVTPDVALRVGMAVGAHFGRGGSVVIGKDTRRSGYMIETALASGLCAVGNDVMLVGPLPTPGIAYITRSMRADAGVVVSASHNPFADNGIKIFAGDGFKLPDEVEAHLEQLMAPGALDGRMAVGGSVGRARRIDDAAGRYVTHLKSAVPSDVDLEGLTIVVDAAHGAAYRVAPAVLEELGAKVIAIGAAPDGTNINERVGATHPEALVAAVRAHGADVGLALDGDADRSIFVDAAGQIVDGDAILAMCARDMHQRGVLRGGGVVATVMSNLGLERSLAEVGLSLVRTPVGDRYVVEAMRRGGFNLGGEQSGHLVFLDVATTGDGVAAALQVLTIMRRTGTPLAALAQVMQRLPQVLHNVAVQRREPLDRLPQTTRAMRRIEQELGDEGRLLVRYSGTENKLRIMLEGPDEARLRAVAEELGELARRELAGTAAAEAGG